ncbi:hypothetical protein [Longimicrobium sp.]|uniref:hypothetical protein n=1 Tax=Longimicrobium sp. TaxID=2029185 RepID=UPI002CFF19EC|nr:hypothetical protein [Longimicrobium sp.]HSU17002.1 hypothetical protein [Longimicrobium sp.]
MRTHALRILTLSTLAVLAACGPHNVPAASPRFEAALALPDTGASADSVAVVIVTGCRGFPEHRRTCAERALDEVLERSGIARAMAALDRIAERDSYLRVEAHGLAHGLGIAAYRSPETVAATFAACPNTQISGCYHGVIQGYFLDLARRKGGVTADDLNAVCAPHRADPELYNQCAHGMGHGLLAVTSGRLPAALEKCDQLADHGARSNCWGGAFMENIVAVTHPEHTAQAHAAVAAGHQHGTEGHGEGDHGATDHDSAHHEGMDHGGMAMDHGAMRHDTLPAWKPLDRNDPLYPCNVVGDRYQQECYMIQTSAILAQNDGDVAKTARACSTAPAAAVRTCYASVGRDMTSYAARDPRRTAELCHRTGMAAAEIGCLQGAAVSLYEVNLKVDDAFALCRAAEGAERKTACYQAAARRIRISTRDDERMAAICGGAEAGFADACLAAANVRREASAR